MRCIDVDELIKKCRERDDDAFSELLSRYTPMISREVSLFVCERLSHDELFSEAAVALHSAAMRFDLSQSGVTFGLFARVCVHNRLVDLVRSLDRLPPFEEYVEGDETGDEGPESRLMSRDMAERLMDSARLALSDYEYRVLVLYIQGYKTREIAKRLDRTPKSVDNAKSRIFSRLRRVFGESEEI